MKNVLLFLSLSFGMLMANEPSMAAVVTLSQKGEKIVKVLCDEHKLPPAQGTIDAVMEKIAASHACKKLSKSKLKAVAYYLSNGSMKSNTNRMHVPEGAKCPVCGMFVSKYPRWAAMIEIDGHTHYFDGVKDMMKYYIFDGDFPFDRKAITQMRVTDFYTLDTLPAHKAWYVLGSKLFGPMGNELIPFSTEAAAKNFIADHGGDRIVRFGDITGKMVMALDGIEYNGD